MVSFSVCAEHRVETPSIYNSTENNSTDSPTDNSSDNNSALSIFNSTDRNMNETEDAVEFIESENMGLIELKYEKVPIDDAYSREILGDINVSDGTLETFTRFGLWLDEKNVDVVAENITLVYVDDDLKVIENYWVFASRPESRESRLEKIKNSKSKNPSPDEMVAFLEEFDEKYPVKYVRTGVVLFITVENKEALLSEISRKDIRMLRAIKNAILEKEEDPNEKSGPLRTIFKIFRELSYYI